MLPQEAPGSPEAFLMHENNWRARARAARESLMIAAGMLCYYPSRLMPRFRERPHKLQVGAGKKKKPGWINADVHPGADAIVFLQWRLPFSDHSLDFIYAEHVMEHVTYPVGVHFLSEARRVLRPGGVVRIAMPDLADLARSYVDSTWRTRDWVRHPDNSHVQTGSEMFNRGMRSWGHQHLYDREELARAMREAGFVRFDFFDPGQSRIPELQNIETRPDSLLVAEAYLD